MVGFINRYVWVYKSLDKKRTVWEWSVWHSPEADNRLIGITMTHKATYTRNGIRYTVNSADELPQEDALQIVRSLYEYEFATSRVK